MVPRRLQIRSGSLILASLIALEGCAIFKDDAFQHCLAGTILTAGIGATLGVTLGNSKASKTAAGIIGGVGAGTASFLICRRAYLQAIVLRQQIATLERPDTLASSEAQTPEHEQVRIIRKAANVRSGPGTNYPPITVASEGTILNVLGHVDRWIIVGLPPDLGLTQKTAFLHESTVDFLVDTPEEENIPGGGIQLLNTLEVIENRAIRLDLNSSLMFESSSSELQRQAFHHLDILSTSFVEFPNSIIYVIGHTDNTGDESANERLSERRAEAVASYLVKQGVAISRLETKGVGSREPIAENTTSDGRARNRRVEIIIVPSGEGGDEELLGASDKGRKASDDFFVEPLSV